MDPVMTFTNISAAIQYATEKRVTESGADLNEIAAVTADELQKVIESFAITNSVVVKAVFITTGHRIDRRGRVYLTGNAGTAEIPTRRFMSRRLAHRWAKAKMGIVFADVTITPVTPVESITIDTTVGTLSDDEQKAI